MEMILTLWQIIGVFVVIVSAFAINTFMTKQNARKIEKLQDKCDEMIEESVARKTFVTIELYTNEVNHLNKTLDEVKSQNTTILEYVKK